MQELPGRLLSQPLLLLPWCPNSSCISSLNFWSISATYPTLEWETFANHNVALFSYFIWYEQISIIKWTKYKNYTLTQIKTKSKIGVCVHKNLHCICYFSFIESQSNCISIISLSNALLLCFYLKCFISSTVNIT